MPKFGITKRERARMLSWIILALGSLMVAEPLLDYIKSELNPFWEAGIGLAVLVVGAYLFNISE